MLRPVAVTLEVIKFQHTVFALPFAFLTAMTAARGIPSIMTIVWTVLAMVGARSAAIGVQPLRRRRHGRAEFAHRDARASRRGR